MSLRAFCTPALIACALLVGAPLPATAQEAAVKEAPIEVLTDLAETLGQAHAIRSLCNGDEDQTWRNYMFTMLNMEGPSGSPRRSAMTSAFNRGFRTQQNDTKSCTPDTSKLEAQIAARGRSLAETAANSYLH